MLGCPAVGGRKVIHNRGELFTRTVFVPPPFCSLVPCESGSRPRNRQAVRAVLNVNRALGERDAMAGKKRCFVTVRALKRLDEKMLCAVLGKFPEYLRTCGLTLPEQPERDALNYDAIRDTCMGGTIPPGLDDVLFFVSILGNKRGQGLIEREARYRGLRLDFSLEGVSCPDFAMRAWLHDWPKNQDLLEAAYARSRIFGKSSYVYHPMIRDLRGRFIEPTPARIAEARARLEDYFANREGLGKGTNILVYDFATEVWFLVRYPGQVERHQAFDEDGNPAIHVFRPEEYDAIIYHKQYGDLRLNTNRKGDHVQYRIVFGHLLFGEGNVFDPAHEMIRLEPLRGECVQAFKCDDIEGLAEIHPVEVCFCTSHQPGMTVTYRSDSDISLIDYNGHDGRLLPNEAYAVQYARFRYRLSHRSDWERITVHQGRTMTYERDGDCAVIEEWLRRRQFVKNPIERV